MIELKKGVHLHVLPTEKYKTIRIYIRFTTTLKRELITKRAILTSLLETNSLHYPDQAQLSAKLADLYGASFGASVGKKGQLHWVNVGMNIVNDKYLGTTNLLKDAVDFLKEVLFYPNVSDGAFDAETFTREQANLKSYLESIAEDKKSYASLALQETYFEDDNQKIPSFGSVADLLKENAASVGKYHFEMLEQDQVDIFVIGDVAETTVASLCKTLPFEDRPTPDLPVFYDQEMSNVIKERQEQETVVQSKLNLGYSTGIYFDDEARFALMVFNGLFGGFPHSKLFMNVREKESLAYYANSSYDSFRGFLTVQSGIEGKNRNKVLRLISEQLEALRKGEIEDLAFEQTKAMLKNQYALGLDSPQAAIETTYLNQLLPETVKTDEEWLAAIENVTKEDVVAVAKAVELQAMFYLEGVEK
jgi:predicted Zn-dependent peptidase